MASSQKRHYYHVCGPKRFHPIFLLDFIVRTSYKEFRLQEYLDAINIPALTEAEVKAIDDAGTLTA